MNVNVEIGHYYFKVLIGGLVHVCIDRKEFVGFASYYNCDTMCVIEYITKTNTIKTEQDSKEKWIAILKALNQAL